jgi:hypothetical protein
MGKSYAEFAREKGEERSGRGRKAAKVAAGVGAVGAVGGAGYRYGVPGARMAREGVRNLKSGGGSKRVLAGQVAGGVGDLIVDDAKRASGAIVGGVRGAGAYIKKGASGAKERLGKAATSKAGQRILGSSTGGRITRGAGAIGAGAAGTAAVLSYLRNRKKKQEPQGVVARGRKAVSRLTNRN